MRRVPSRSPVYGVALALAGCSVVLPFDSYTAGSGDAGPDQPDARPDPRVDGSASSSSSSGGDAAPCDDVLSTSNHCGSCDHDCLGDPCENGFCVATVLTATDPGGYGIDVDAENVYWGVYRGENNGGQVYRVAKKAPGGARATLLDTPQPRFEPNELKVDGSYLVVLDGSPGSGTSSIYRVPLAGGSAAALGPCAKDGTSGLALDGTQIYFGLARDDDPSVIRVAKSGATCEPRVAGGMPFVAQLALDDGVLYLTQTPPSAGPDGSLFALAADSDTPVAIAADTVLEAWGVLPDGDSLLVTTEEGRVLRVAKDGSSTTELTSEVEGLPRGLAADARHVYWANELSEEIVSYDRQTKERRVMASGQPGVRLLASDAERLYWVTSSSVMRVAK